MTKKIKTRRDGRKAANYQVEENLVWKLIFYVFQLYESYEIKFPAKISFFFFYSKQEESGSHLALTTTIPDSVALGTDHGRQLATSDTQVLAVASAGHSVTLDWLLSVAVMVTAHVLHGRRNVCDLDGLLFSVVALGLLGLRLRSCTSPSRCCSGVGSVLRRRVGCDKVTVGVVELSPVLVELFGEHAVVHTDHTRIAVDRCDTSDRCIENTRHNVVFDVGRWSPGVLLLGMVRVRASVRLTMFVPTMGLTGWRSFWTVLFWRRWLFVRNFTLTGRYGVAHSAGIPALVAPFDDRVVRISDLDVLRLRAVVLRRHRNRWLTVTVWRSWSARVMLNNNRAVLVSAMISVRMNGLWSEQKNRKDIKS